MITREFNLYLHAGHSIPLVINTNQYDRGEQWLFTLFNADGTQYVPSSGAIVGIKSDNLGIINSGTVDSQGRVVINETQQMTAAVGKAVFELVIDDGTHGTANFVVLVEPKPGDNADLSETDISMIEQAIEAASTIKPYGSPLVASTVAGMTDHDKVYVYVGSETGYTSGNWYYWDGSAWTSGGVYNSVAVQTDTTLTLSGVAADAKKTGDEISELKSEITQSTGMSADFKVALENLVNQLVYKGNDPTGRTYINALHSAMYPPATLSYITAVYSQGSTVVREGDSLDDLKADLVVTAYMNTGSSNVVTNYVLSGELTEGISVITVTYGGKTATFNVTVSESERHMPSNYTWLYDPRQGELLSEQSYVTKSGNGTETINENGELVLHCDNNGGSASTNVLLSFPLTDTTTTNGILSARARLIDLAILDSATPIGQRLQLSNGSSGCSIYLGRQASGSNIRVQYYEGSTAKTIDTDFAIDELHVFEVKLQNGTQSFSIDGTEIFSTTTLSSSYTSNNVIRLQATSTARTPNGLTTAFDWIAYYEQ